MGRKIRRNIETMPVIAVQNTDIFPTAIYARLSVENSGKDDDGAAIENQIEVCKEYIREMPDLQLIKIYQDNGWTGTVMHRPAFDDLMEDVKAGLIKAVVVRDLSRFARNYIETGTYQESVFPKEDFILILTSRTDEYKEMTLSFLKDNGIRYDQILFNIPMGERIVVNDRKPSGIDMAVAINTSRDLFSMPEIKRET